MTYRKLFSFFLLLAVFVLVGCGGVSTVNTAVPPNQTDVPETAVSMNTMPTIEIPPTSTPTATPTTEPTPLPPDLSITDEGLFLYPVPEIYAGDLVTFQVLAYVPENVDPSSVTVHVLVDYQDVAEGTLSTPNLAGNSVGLFEWAWDTSNETGEHLVHVILDRFDTITVGDENGDNNQVSLTVSVRDPQELPLNEQNATWVTAETDCCLVNVVSGTAAYRDLPQLLLKVETAVRQVANRLEEEPGQKLDVYLIDRVIGQGGYAGNALVVSYLDRQYSGQGIEQILTHEAIHLLDRQFAPDRIPFLAEGLAVWGSGGHYKPENIRQRSVALVSIGQYIPLSELIDNFYLVQHEIGYLEAAGFVSYLVDTYGWPQFKLFYADVTAEDGSTLSQAMDINLQQYFGVTLAEVEVNWLAYLDSLPEDRMAQSDLQTSIRYYNVMRRYQQAYDPTAYFLTAWLPYPGTLRTEGNPADLTRHPQTEINVTLEVMLQAADVALRSGDYNKANVLLNSITRVLDNDGVFIDPLAASHLNLVRALTKQGYEVQQVSLEGGQAVAQVSGPETAVLIQLSLTLSGQNWILSN